MICCPCPYPSLSPSPSSSSDWATDYQPRPHAVPDLPSIALLKVKNLAQIQSNPRRKFEQIGKFGRRGCGEYFACRGENDALHHGGERGVSTEEMRYAERVG